MHSFLSKHLNLARIKNHLNNKMLSVANNSTVFLASSSTDYEDDLYDLDTVEKLGLVEGSLERTVGSSMGYGDYHDYQWVDLVKHY